MKLDRVVIRKVLLPKLLVEINLEFDQPDGTTKVVRDYAEVSDMSMTVHNDLIAMQRLPDGDVYQGSYKLFRDSARQSFSSADSVVKYMRSATSGYSAINQRSIPRGATLFR